MEGQTIEIEDKGQEEHVQAIMEEDVQEVGENEEEVQVIGENEEDVQVIGENEEDVQVIGENEEDVQVIGENEEDVQVIGENEEDVQVIGENEEHVQVIGENEHVQVIVENEEQVQIVVEEEDQVQVIVENEEHVEVIVENEEHVQELVEEEHIQELVEEHVQEEHVQEIMEEEYVQELVGEGERHELAIEQQPANVVVNSDEGEAIRGIREKIKRVAPFIIGILIQILIGGNSILARRGLKEGMRVSVFLFYKNTLASFVLLMATLITRTPWPKMTLCLIVRIIALSVLEPVLSQIAIFAGMKFTPGSFTSCLIATGPAWTLLASWILRLEHLAITERRSQAKLLGMVMVISGGLVVGLYDGPTITVLQPSRISSRNVVYSLSTNWIRGPLLVSFSVLASVLYNILMQTTTKKTDASPLFLTASICTLGALMNLIVAVAMESGSGFTWIVGLNTKLICYLYSGIVVSGFTSFLQSMLLRERGAVFVTSFSPLSTIFVMMVIVLKQVIHVGSVLGAVLIVTGLFILQWGKCKASASENDSRTCSMEGCIEGWLLRFKMRRWPLNWQIFRST